MMEFLKPSLFITTTGQTTTSGSATAVNVLYRDSNFRWAADTNPNNTTGAVTISYVFDKTVTIDRIGMTEINFENFRIFYNGDTSSTFPINGTHDRLLETTESYWVNNTTTGMYLKTDSVAVTSVSIDIYTTSDNGSPGMGFWFVNECITDLDGIRPTFNNYRTNLNPKQVVHELGDGSIRVQNIKNKFSAMIRIDHLGETASSDVLDIFDHVGNFMFIHEATMTAEWDLVAVECVMVGDYEFHDYTMNQTENGRSGSIEIREIAEN